MTISSWRTKIAILAGLTLAPAGLTLTFASGAGAATHPAAGSSRPTPVPTRSARVSVDLRAGVTARPSRTAGPPAARPGDNGTVKIHRSATPVMDRRNEPHVCVFYLDAFSFDAGQSVWWRIKSWPPAGTREVVAHGTLTLDSSGNGHTADMTLASGHYKLYWNFAGEHGFAKQKVFWVECAASTTPPGRGTPSPGVSPTPSRHGKPSPAAAPSPSARSGPAAGGAGSPPGPSSHSGLPITGWPLALIAGAGAVLLGTGGTAIVLARRRRSLPSGS